MFLALALFSSLLVYPSRAGFTFFCVANGTSSFINIPLSSSSLRTSTVHVRDTLNLPFPVFISPFLLPVRVRGNGRH